MIQIHAKDTSCITTITQGSGYSAVINNSPFSFALFRGDGITLSIKIVSCIYSLTSEYDSFDEEIVTIKHA
jgi:hypothetical protein